MLPEKSKKELSSVEYGQSKHTKAVVVGLSVCNLCCFPQCVLIVYLIQSKSNSYLKSGARIFAFQSEISNN